jgi:hypothetical protein
MSETTSAANANVSEAIQQLLGVINTKVSNDANCLVIVVNQFAQNSVPVCQLPEHTDFYSQFSRLRVLRPATVRENVREK